MLIILALPPDSSSLSPYFPTHLGCLEHLGIELSSSKEEEEDLGEMWCVLSLFSPPPLLFIGGNQGAPASEVAWASRNHVEDRGERSAGL